MQNLESNVRSYCRSFPTTFVSAKGAILNDQGGKRYIDFLAGAGALNYGHNPDVLKAALLDYLACDGVTHSLDLMTQAKQDFIERFDAMILQPRAMRYRFMFPGPTGTNAVEAALKLARKVTGRTNIAAFTNAFHGVTLGSLAATGNQRNRKAAGVPLSQVDRLPFDGYCGPDGDTMSLAETLYDDPSSGYGPPAAFLVETIQAEGGIRIASTSWLQKLSKLAKRLGSLLIVDDIQVGCGRLGSFFSFECHGLEPDIVCLSKSLSGYGLPLSLVLLRPEIDVWEPGEHNGTFRGHNLAFVTAAAACDYWGTRGFADSLRPKADALAQRVGQLVERFPQLLPASRGAGFIQGLVFSSPEHAARISSYAFERGLIAETCGGCPRVLKLLPPITIDDDELDRGLTILSDAIEQAASEQWPRSGPRLREAMNSVLECYGN